MWMVETEGRCEIWRWKGMTALRATTYHIDRSTHHSTTGVLSSRLETHAAPIQFLYCNKFLVSPDLPIQICAALRRDPSLPFRSFRSPTTPVHNFSTSSIHSLFGSFPRPARVKVMRFPPNPFSFSGITNRLFIPPRPRLATSSSSQQHPYLVPRNSRGTLPVYSDVRNAGSRYLISIRNVEGNIKVCDPTPHDRSPLTRITKGSG
jgi:Mitochondrial large subunit ribosomal protein (Img2)